MKTVLYSPTQNNIAVCAGIIKEGGLVAFPTETVYGLGANALLPDSVRLIYAAKGRPSDNPLIVHIADKKTVYDVAAEVPEAAEIVIDKFMPGPVTVVLPKKDTVPDEVTGGLKTVAVRMPKNEIALSLISLAGCPVCAPSANFSGKPSPTTAAHVLFDLDGKIPAILDGGGCEVGVESTVIDFTSARPRLLRAGGMPVETLEKAIGVIEVVKNSKVALCPGMKYKHYSPEADVIAAVVGEGMAVRMAAAYDESVSAGKKTVIIALENTVGLFEKRNVWCAGADYRDYAHNLFAFLRRADDEGFDTVVCQGAEEYGLGATVYNRLSKASGGKTV